jgi:phosphoribosylglycinamide formyltransferase-1
MLRIGWFSSGRDAAARNLLRAVSEEISQNNLDAKISWIFCNRDLGDTSWNSESSERQKFFWLCQDLKIPVTVFSHKRFLPDVRKIGLTDEGWMNCWRDRYGTSIVSLLSDKPVDVVLMAGYMLVVGKPEIENFNLLNLHPAIPGGPAGTWQDVIHKIIDEQHTTQGAMIHLATEVLDRGAVVAYFEFPITGDAWQPLWASWDPISDTASKESHPLFLKIRGEGERREIPLIKKVVKLLSEKIIEVKSGSVFCNSIELSEGFRVDEKDLDR